MGSKCYVYVAQTVGASSVIRYCCQQAITIAAQRLLYNEFFVVICKSVPLRTVYQLAYDFFRPNTLCRCRAISSSAQVAENVLMRFQSLIFVSLRSPVCSQHDDNTYLTTVDTVACRRIMINARGIVVTMA